MVLGDCDCCGGNIYGADDPFIEIRQRRPSDARDMTCVLAGHKNCLAPTTRLPSIAKHGGVATHEQWIEWIESHEARVLGYLFVS